VNSKQRVTATINGTEPDRAPIGEIIIDFDTVGKIIGHETYYRAKAKSQIAFWEGRHDEVIESWTNDHIALHEKLDLDIVCFPNATWVIPPETDDEPPRKIDDNTWEDKYGRVYKYSDVTADFTCVKDPVMEAKAFTTEEFEKEPTPAKIDPRSLEILNTVIKRFKDEKYIICREGGEVGMTFLGGMERGLIELITSPEAVKAATKYIKRCCELTDEIVVHPDTDAVLWGQDFGFKTAAFISPAMFREYFLEANKDRVKRIHEKFGKKVIKHCCGNMNEYLDMFIEIGYDAYQAIQPTAHMDICKLKKDYGDKITLWGGVALENIIGGTAEDVRADVRRSMQCAKPGGRFILGTSHSIAVGSNYDNFMAMLDEYQKHCNY
jgi:uroporphyrinogen decarboxylase